MADAIIYSSMDSGGPGIPSGTHVQRMYNVLVPCLVTGYGAGADAKPGQGWTLVHSDLPNGFTLMAPDGVFYIFVKPTSARTNYHGYYCQVYMAEALSTYEYPPVGTNVRSGNHSANYATASTRHWITSFSSARGTSNWWLVARGSQVILSTIAFGVTSTAGSAAGDRSGSGDVMFFGNLVMRAEGTPANGPQNSFILGGYEDSASLDSSSSTYYDGRNMQGQNTRLRDPLTGVVELDNLTSIQGNPVKHSSVGHAHIQADPFAADLVLHRADAWMNGQGAIGYMPGMFYGSRPAHYRVADLLSLLGLGTTYAATLDPALIEGQPFYVIPTYWGSLLVSLKEEYWV